MNYQTTYYYGNRAAARVFAKQAALTAGGSTLVETEGYWLNHDLHTDEGATVTVLHKGGTVSGSLNGLARQAASDFGEERVLRVTVQTLNAEQLDAHDYSTGHPTGTAAGLRQADTLEEQ